VYISPPQSNPPSSILSARILDSNPAQKKKRYAVSSGNIERQQGKKKEVKKATALIALGAHHHAAISHRMSGASTYRPP
jgi:hypothetical protein